jgi:U3 small nucleolar RNA-associated protein 22
MPSPAPKRRKLQHAAGKRSLNSDTFQSTGSGVGDLNNGMKQLDEISNEKLDAGSVENESGETNGADSWALQIKPTKTKSIPVQRAKQQHYPGGAYSGELYKSNIFKLQVDELLEQLKPDFLRAETSIATLLRTVKNIVEAIPPRDAISVSVHFKAAVYSC